MRRTPRRAIILLTAISAAVAAAGVAITWPRPAAATDQATTADQATPSETIRAFDALGDSGTAGIDAAEAAAITAEAQADLTGDITFSQPGGTFQNQLSVQLSTSISGAQIRYTTDGSQPTSASTLYAGTGVTLTRTTELRAQAFVSGTATGEMGTAVYIARSISATHDLPLLVMDAYGGGKPGRDDYEDVAVMLMDQSAGTTTSLGQTPAVATRGGFHLRGQSSSNFAKAPYRLEFWDNQDDDVDYPAFGMPADSDWVLRGPFPDKTLIRDAFAYSLGRDMGLEAPRFALVELYLNLDSQPLASSDYQGVYMFVETIKRSSDRLDIQKLKDEDLTEPNITGGYILQINAMASEPPTLTCTGSSTTCWSDLEVVEPDDLLPAQQAWITNYIQKFHDALHGSDPANPITGYPAYIDVDSFVNRIIHNELAREGDAYIRSTHFYKDRGGKLVAGPLWDYDLGYDAVPMFGMFGGSSVEGWQYQPLFPMGGADWFSKLMANSTFSNQVKARWQELRRGVLSDTQMRARMTTLTAGLTNAAARNFQKWPNLTSSTVGMFQTQTASTWQGQLDIMRTFLTQRAAWLDQSSNWGGSVPVTTSPTGGTTQPPTTGSGQGCTATYSVTSEWNSGFQGEVRVTAGASAISGWTVRWTFTAGQTVTQAWNGTLSSAGSTVTVTNASYNGALSAGGSTTFGFTGTWFGSNPVPALSCSAS